MQSKYKYYGSSTQVIHPVHITGPTVNPPDRPQGSTVDPNVAQMTKGIVAPIITNPLYQDPLQPSTRKELEQMSEKVLTVSEVEEVQQETPIIQDSDSLSKLTNKELRNAYLDSIMYGMKTKKEPVNEYLCSGIRPNIKYTGDFKPNYESLNAFKKTWAYGMQVPAPEVINKIDRVLLKGRLDPPVFKGNTKKVPYTQRGGLQGQDRETWNFAR